MSGERITPADILASDLRQFEQEDALDKFRDIALQRARNVYPKTLKIQTPEDKTQTIRQATRSASIHVYFNAIEKIVKNGKSGDTLELDNNERRPVVGIKINGGFPLSESDQSSAIQNGIDAGKEDILNLLSPTETFTFGNVKAPLIPWHRNLAPKVLDDIIEDEGEMVGYQNTTIPGLQVELYYRQGQAIPTRSLVNHPEKIPLDGDIFNR